MYDIIMPKLGLDMESGTLLSWYKQEGDQVEKGKPLFEVETEKVTMDVEASHSGYLRKIVRQAGEEVEVNTIVAYIGEQGETLPGGTSPEAGGKPESRPAPENNISETGTPPEVGEEPGSPAVIHDAPRIKISPLARKICQELGIDWHREPIKGSSPTGRILKADVLAYVGKQRAGAAAEQQPAEEVLAALQKNVVTIRSAKPLTGVRNVIANRMSLSHQTIPHIVLHAKADVTTLIAFREKLNAKVLTLYGVRLTYTDFLLKMCASALQEHRAINSSLQNNTNIVYEDINIGFAVAVNDDLVVPTIYQCDQLGLVEIARKKTALIGKARNGTLEPDDLRHGTFTVTNLGMYRIRSASPIINPPQAAILFVGEIYEEPAVMNGEVIIRSCMELSLACDHRIIDGAAGARFLQHLVELIEEPDMLVL